MIEKVLVVYLLIGDTVVDQLQKLVYNWTYQQYHSLVFFRTSVTAALSDEGTIPESSEVLTIAVKCGMITGIHLLTLEKLCKTLKERGKLIGYKCSDSDDIETNEIHL